jgi:Dcp1-like decapping family
MAQRRPGHGRRNPSVEVPRYPPPGSTYPQPEPNHLPPHLPHASDYESDTQGYMSEYPTQPPPRDRTNAEVNLSVLRRHNSDILSILNIAPYAVIYEFSPLPEPTWSKTGIEGSLFINQLTSGPYGEDRYNAIILNRRGLENFEVPLIEGENAGVEVTEEYVIISFKRGHELKIYGVYIFSEGVGTSTAQTRELTAELMKTLAVQSGASRQAAEAAAAEARAQHTNGHVKEAEATLEEQGMGTPMGRQISLQQLFGQQRAEDASFSARAHNVDRAADRSNPMPGPLQDQQPNALLDLFRQAGIGRARLIHKYHSMI